MFVLIITIILQYFFTNNALAYSLDDFRFERIRSYNKSLLQAMMLSGRFFGKNRNLNDLFSFNKVFAGELHPLQHNIKVATKHKIKLDLGLGLGFYPYYTNHLSSQSNNEEVVQALSPTVYTGIEFVLAKNILLISSVKGSLLIDPVGTQSNSADRSHGFFSGEIGVGGVLFSKYNWRYIVSAGLSLKYENFLHFQDEDPLTEAQRGFGIMSWFSGAMTYKYHIHLLGLGIKLNTGPFVMFNGTIRYTEMAFFPSFNLEYAIKVTELISLKLFLESEFLILTILPSDYKSTGLFCDYINSIFGIGIRLHI